MIVLITCQDEKGKIVVSHGVDELMRNVILPCEPIDYFRRFCNARYSSSIGEWVIDDKFDSECA